MTKRQETIEFAGLQMFDVFDRFKGWVWSGMASSRIHALDLYVRTVDSTYATYTSLLVDSVDDEDSYVYEHNGDLWAVLENTEIYARPRNGAAYAAPAAPGVTAPAAPAAPVRAAYGAPAVRGTVTPAAPPRRRYEVRSDLLYADTSVHAVWDTESQFVVEYFAWDKLDRANDCCD